MPLLKTRCLGKMCRQLVAYCAPKCENLDSCVAVHCKHVASTLLRPLAQSGFLKSWLLRPIPCRIPVPWQRFELAFIMIEEFSPSSHGNL